tara:strand:- start:729 stop:1058 length:330 start_codon:yes stop_codon:yes gene_type:complete
LVSFGVVQTASLDPFEFNVKWGGTKVPPLLLAKDVFPALVNLIDFVSVLVFIEEEVLLGRIIGPNVLDCIKGFAVVLQLLEILHHFKRRTSAHRKIDELILGCGPRGIL